MYALEAFMLPVVLLNNSKAGLPASMHPCLPKCAPILPVLVLLNNHSRAGLPGMHVLVSCTHASFSPVMVLLGNQQGRALWQEGEHGQHSSCGNNNDEKLRDERIIG
eukprot:1148296-Pelagomonas_calceolata.AAC.3